MAFLSARLQFAPSISQATIMEAIQPQVMLVQIVKSAPFSLTSKDRTVITTAMPNSKP